MFISLVKNPNEVDILWLLYSLYFILIHRFSPHISSSLFPCNLFHWRRVSCLDLLIVLPCCSLTRSFVLCVFWNLIFEFWKIKTMQVWLFWQDYFIVMGCFPARVAQVWFYLFFDVSHLDKRCPHLFILTRSCLDGIRFIKIMNCQELEWYSNRLCIRTELHANQYANLILVSFNSIMNTYIGVSCSVLSTLETVLIQQHHDSHKITQAIWSTVLSNLIEEHIKTLACTLLLAWVYS